MEMGPGLVPPREGKDQRGMASAAVSASIIADSRSSTSTMAKGGGQLPSR